MVQSDLKDYIRGCRMSFISYLHLILLISNQTFEVIAVKEKNLELNMPSVLKDRGQLRSKINKHMLIGVSDVRLFTGVEKGAGSENSEQTAMRRRERKGRRRRALAAT